MTTDRLARRSDLPASGSLVHLMGAAGAGMRGLGLLLSDAGYRLSGCDRAGVAELSELAAGGSGFRAQHDPSHVEGVDLLIHTSAVPDDHPELQAARRQGVPTMKRSRALAALLNEMRMAAVAGTHGKTTITALAGLAGTAAGLDPVVAVGGRVARWGDGFARPGSGSVALVEADEYDRSFLELDPSLVLISSVEQEHLDTYGSFEELERAYRALAQRAVGRDGVLYSADDPGARAIGSSLEGVSYGLAADADYRLELSADDAGHQRCRLVAPSGEVAFTLEIPGRHNAQNAAGALAIVLCLADEAPVRADGSRESEARLLASGALDSAFEGFRGVERRLELLLDDAGVALLDDYAHHPTEVEASIAALRQAYPERRLVVVFQPHLYSRTRDFAAEFAHALQQADEALVMPIYPAREAPIRDVDSGLIAEAAGGSVRVVTADEALDAARAARGPTALVFMGAGDVTQLARLAAGERADVVGG